MAQGIVAFTEVFILVFIMLKRDPRIFSRKFYIFCGKALVAAGFTAIAAYLTLQYLPLQLADLGPMLLVKLGVITLVSFTVYITASTVFRFEESNIILTKLKKIILKPVKI